MGRSFITKQVEVEVEVDIDADDFSDLSPDEIRTLIDASAHGIDNIYAADEIVASYDWSDLISEMHHIDPLALRSCLRSAGVDIDATPATAESVAADLRLNWTDLIKAMHRRHPDALSIILLEQGIRPAALPAPTYESVRDGFDALSVESKAQLVAHIFHHIIRSR